MTVDTALDVIEQHWDHCPPSCTMPHKLITDVANQQVYKWNRSAKWVDPDDVHQEAWLAYMQRRSEIHQFLAEGDRAKARYLIRDAVYRFCRREKAWRGGWDTDDEHMYSLKALKRFLPAAFGGDIANEGGMSAEPRRGSRGGAVSGNELDTALIDVRWGLSQLTWVDRQALFDSYSGADGHEQDPTCRRALRRLQEVLGGPPLD